MSAAISSRDRRLLVLLLAGALVLRLGVAAAVALAHRDATPFHTPDSGRYLELGAALAQGRGYVYGGAPELFRVPGFPMLVALATLGGAPTALTIVAQAIIGTLTVWLAFMATRTFAGTRAALVAAGIVAIEPGQLAWGAMVMTETLFTMMVVAAFAAAVRLVDAGSGRMLVVAVIAAALSAYVRTIGYVLPFVLLAAVWWAAGTRRRALVSGRRVAIGLGLAVLILGAWHVRNGLTTGYWGFSLQFERATYLVGGAAVTARTTGDYRATVRSMFGEIEEMSTAGAAPANTAALMRTDGIARIMDEPVAFATTYLAGIVTTVLHPGTGAVLRLRDGPGPYDGPTPSATQYMTIGRWSEARVVLGAKGVRYWIVTAVLALAVGGLWLSFVAGAWRLRQTPAVRVACGLVACFLLLSGGPDGESRRRVPIVPLLAVVAAAGWRSNTGRT